MFVEGFCKEEALIRPVDRRFICFVAIQCMNCFRSNELHLLIKFAAIVFRLDIVKRYMI